MSKFMSAASAFPSPNDAIMTLIRIVTGQQTATLPDAVLALYAVIGYVLTAVFSDPTGAITPAPTLHAAGAKQPSGDQDTVLLLRALHGDTAAKQDVQSKGWVAGASIGSSAIAQLLLPLLLNWVKQFLTGGGLQALIQQLLSSSTTPATP